MGCRIERREEIKKEIKIEKLLSYWQWHSFVRSLNRVRLYLVLRCLILLTHWSVFLISWQFVSVSRTCLETQRHHCYNKGYIRILYPLPIIQHDSQYHEWVKSRSRSQVQNMRLYLLYTTYTIRCALLQVLWARGRCSRPSQLNSTHHRLENPPPFFNFFFSVIYQLIIYSICRIAY